MKPLHYVIPVQPVSKKNSQRIINCGGRPRILPSAAYEDYREMALWHLKRPQEPISHPVTVRVHFYRQKRTRGDLTNYLEAIDDILVDAGILQDDNWKIIASHDGSRMFHDKENPRTEIWIEDFEEVSKDG